MFYYIKLVIKLFIPPIIIKILKGRRYNNTFDGVYTNFNEISDLTHYNNSHSLQILHNELMGKLDQHKESLAQLPIAHNRSQITNLLSLLISSVPKSKIHILDYGGGAGSTYIDCFKAFSSFGIESVEYYIYDFPETMKVGKELFPKYRGIFTNNLCNVSFVDDISKINSIDIVHLGSVLQYIPNYSEVIKSIIEMSPNYFYITDNFMGLHPTFATVQVNMIGRRMAYWIFQLEEIISLFDQFGYRLINKTTNYQPFHSMKNFPEQYQVSDSCNLLFKKYITR